MSNSLLIPYKYCSLDLININPLLNSNSSKYYLTITSKYWYRIYQLPKLTITLDSSVFDGKIRAIAQSSQDIHVYVAVKQKIYIMKYQTCIGQIDLQYPGSSKIQNLYVLYPCIVASIENYLYVGYIYDRDNIEQFVMKWNILKIIHPPTYLNKVLILTTQELLIFNIITKKIIACIDIKELFNINKLQYDEQIFKLVEPSPALNIIALFVQCEQNNDKNMILLINLLSFEVLQIYNVQSVVVSIGFNSHGSIPLIGIVMDNIVQLIDLNKKIMVQTYEKQTPIDWIQFIPNSQTFYIGLSQDNSIQELSYDPDQPNYVTVRERQGFKSMIQQVNFIGLDDDPMSSVNILAYSNNSQAEIRWVSIINENMNQRLSLKQNNTRNSINIDSEKNEIQLQKIINMSFSINRENDWSNILTAHEKTKNPCFWNSQNRTILKIKAEMHQSAIEKSSFQNGSILFTFVTNCGNYGLLCLSDGRIIKITMQSGRHIKTIKLDEISNFIFVDPQNQYLISAQDNNKISFIDFYSGKIYSTQNTDFQIILMVGSKTSSLLLTGLSNSQILVWDFTQFKIVRKLSGGQDKINHSQFTSNNQFVIASFMDSTLLIWSVITGSLIQKIQLNKPIITFDISPDNSVLIASFQNSRSIAVFNSNLNNQYQISNASKQLNMKFHSQIQIQSSDYRQQIYSIKQKVETESKINKLNFDLELEQNHPIDLITFTVLEDGRWVPILHIDQIRERNKVTISQEDINLPFFMDFRNIDQQKQNMLTEIKQKTKEKQSLEKSKKDKFLSELQSNFESLLETQEYEDIFQLIRQMNPSQYDYELRSAFLGKPFNISKTFSFFVHIFQKQNDLDLKITYLHRFLEIAFDDDIIQYDEDMKKNIDKIKTDLQNHWCKLEEMKDYIDIIVDYIRIRTK